MKGSSVINNFFGDVSNTQFQQGTRNSSQYYSVEKSVDFEKIIKIIEGIKKYENTYDEEFGDKAQEIRETVDKIYDLAQKRDEPAKTMKLLEDLKNITFGITGSLIANGIQIMIGGLLNK